MKIRLQILFYVISVLIGGSTCFAQETNDTSLDLRIEGARVKGKDIPSVLENIAHSYKVAIGLEKPFHLSSEHENAENKKPNDSEVGLIIPRDGTLEEVLNELLSLNSTYSWTRKGGVINVTPLIQRDMHVADILDIQLELFEFEERPGVMSVGDSLVKTQEVKEILKAQNIRPLQFYFASDLIKPPKDNTYLSHRFVQATVREVLNWVVKEGTRKFWMVSRWGNKNSYLTVITS